MKLVSIFAFTMMATAAGATECPDLTKYICKGDDGEFELNFNQQTVGEYQQYDVPLLGANGMKAVIANNQKDGDDTDYSIASCEKKKLVVEEYMEEQTLNLVGKYTFSANKKGELQYLINMKLTFGDKSEETKDKIKCRLKK